MDISIPTLTFYASILVAYLFLLSYVSDKNLLNYFGLKPDTHSRSFHQHVTQGFQILMHPIFLFALIFCVTLFSYLLPLIDPTIHSFLTLPPAIVVTASIVGWFNAKATITVIKQHSEPYMTLILKHRTEPVYGTVVLQDSIKLIAYLHDDNSTIVVPWGELSEYTSNPDRISVKDKIKNA